MSANVAPVLPKHGLSRVGGSGLVGFAALYLGRECLDFALGPPPRAGADLLSWMAAHRSLLASQSEVLFFALMCLIPAVPALYERFKDASPASAALGCGTLAAAIPVLAMLDIVHGRFAFPVYGIRLDTPTVAEFALAVYYGGLHAVQLMLGFAIVMLIVAMPRSAVGSPIRWGGLVAAAAAILNGYPWVLGSAAALALQAVASTWWAAVGWRLYRTENT